MVAPPPSLVLHRAAYAGVLVQPRHAHAELQISMLLRGGVEETVAGATATGVPLHIAIKDAGVEHANRWAPSGAGIARLELADATIAALTGDTTAPEWRWRFDTAAARAFLRIFADASRTHVAADDVDVVDLLAALVARPTSVTSGAPPAWLVEVVRRVDATWVPSLDTAQLARAARVHPVYLARCVRRWYGVSVGDLLRRERLRRTVAQLAETRDRVSMIALAHGYADEAHCARAVRAAFGLAPAALRRRLTQ